MKIILLVSSLVALTALMGFHFRASAKTADPQNLVAGNTAFALDLYDKLKRGQGNLFFSPYSISTALAMTYAGARGQTEKQMARALHLGTNQAAVPALFGELQKQLNGAEEKREFQLNIANGLWSQKGEPFLPDFLKISTDQFAAKITEADFRSDADSVRKEINDWVSAKTKGKIEDLIPAGFLDRMTRLVLVNAIYFKGTWAHEFKKDKTYPATFYSSSSQTNETPLMNQTVDLSYAETRDIQVLMMPYAGNNISMVILLPRQRFGLSEIESTLTPATLTEWLGQLHSEKVNVYFPKFKITQEFSLGDTLAAMGMTAPFSTQADFSGMNGKRDLFISAVVHKAYVDVNEEGTEAAAATGVAVRALAVHAPQPIRLFRADHPFLFLVRDNRSGSILFLGRIVNPGK